MKSKRYREFFVESIEGEAFMTKLNDLISSLHEKAEREPELSRDYVQQARGVREVVKQVNILSIKQGDKE
jgi:hypothetical protein